VAVAAALLLTAVPAAAGGEGGRTLSPAAAPPPLSAQAPGTERKDPPRAPIDAGLLADLDLLDSADYRRDREAARRQGLLERLRLLEAERTRAGSADPAGAASTRQGPPIGGAGETRR